MQGPWVLSTFVSTKEEASALKLRYGSKYRKLNVRLVATR